MPKDQKQENQPLKIMINNLQKNKDAVVILGNDIVRDAKLFIPTEKNEKTYCRKQLVKQPKEFWEMYNTLIAEDEYNTTGFEAQKAVLKLLDTGIVETVIDYNYDGYISDRVTDDINYISLRGDRRKLLCSGCGKLVDYKDVQPSKKLTHDMIDSSVSCRGMLSPTIPFYNGVISKDIINRINESIFNDDGKGHVTLNTHALILIGCDYSDEFLNEIIDSYQAIRKDMNLSYLMIMITYKNPDLIEVYNAEFGTTEEIDSSLYRLIDLLKK